MRSISDNFQIVNFQKKYKSMYGVPVIDRFETSIYQIKYYTNCLSCNFCNATCCSNGVDIDINNVKRIMENAEKIEHYIKIPKNEWFCGDYKNDDEFPGGRYTRTKIKNNSCVFLNGNGRRCMIHRFCIENDIDFHILKPIVSSLFPITFDEGLLHPSDETLDSSLICLNQGSSLYQGVREEILYYFGLESVNELDYYEEKFINLPLNNQLF